jgi:TonB-dependent SusC/RagA subfamily outer membrane receptor
MKRFISVGFLFLAFISGSAQNSVPKNTTIFWDTSLSMEQRDIEKDFSVLNKVIARNPNQEVQLILFNILTEEKTYSIREGNWDILKNDLLAVTYDGANRYGNLENLAKYTNIYLFTDGRRAVENDVIILPKNSYLINSSAGRDEEFLKRTALINRNRLMDFAAILPENIGSLKKSKTQNTATVSGRVYIDNVPTGEILVAVKGMPGAVKTQNDGSFMIEAALTDSLLVTSRANNTFKIIPISQKDNNTIFLEPNVFSLEEVVLIEQQQPKEELVNTAIGKENKEKIGYAVQSIDDEDITPIQTDVSQAVLNKFSNVNLGNEDDLSKATMRSNTSILLNNYSLVVIDGVPQRQSNSANDGAGSQTKFDYVNPENIASIEVLKGLAATNKYGNLGANGVILITTKTAQANKNGGGPIDLARLTDNVYSEETMSSSGGSVSTIEKLLQSSVSEDDAYATYLLMRSSNKADINFYLDAFAYFNSINKRRAIGIVSTILELFPNDISLLRAVSLALSSAGSHDEVIWLNREILNTSEDNVQAYLDIALAKRASKDLQGGLNDLLDLELGGAYPSLNLSGVSKTINREVRNLIFQHKSQLNTTNLDPKYLNNIKYNVRLVFEWNNPETEFKLQFVNPQKRYFNWEHTNSNSPDRIKDEIINGYTSEEFEFYGEEAKGTWILNATYLGNLEAANTSPLVLKCTLYQNFGYPNQTKEEILVHFRTPGEVKQLKTLVVK